MAKQLPARNAFPDLQPEGILNSGSNHYRDHVEKIVKGQHFLMAYYGKQHIAKFWPAARLRISTAGGQSVSTWYTMRYFHIIPRLDMTDIEYRFRTDTDGTGDFAISILDTSFVLQSSKQTAVAVGTNYNTDTFAVNRSNQSSILVVGLRMDPGTTYLDLLNLGVWDKDLTAVTLP